MAINFSKIPQAETVLPMTMEVRESIFLECSKRVQEKTEAVAND